MATQRSDHPFEAELPHHSPEPREEQQRDEQLQQQQRAHASDHGRQDVDRSRPPEVVRKSR